MYKHKHKVLLLWYYYIVTIDVIYLSVSLVALEGNVTRLGRFANYLRNIIPHPDVSLTEMVAKAIGELALCEGTYTAG